MEPDTTRERVTITVLATQLQALRDRLGPDLSDEDLYSTAAIAVLLYLPAPAVVQAILRNVDHPGGTLADADKRLR